MPSITCLALNSGPVCLAANVALPVAPVAVAPNRGSRLEGRPLAKRAKHNIYIIENETRNSRDSLPNPDDTRNEVQRAAGKGDGNWQF